MEEQSSEQECSQPPWGWNPVNKNLFPSTPILGSYVKAPCGQVLVCSVTWILSLAELKNSFLWTQESWLLNQGPTSLVTTGAISSLTLRERSSFTTWYKKYSPYPPSPQSPLPHTHIHTVLYYCSFSLLHSSQFNFSPIIFVIYFASPSRHFFHEGKCLAHSRTATINSIKKAWKRMRNDDPLSKCNSVPFQGPCGIIFHLWSLGKSSIS